MPRLVCVHSLAIVPSNWKRSYFLWMVIVGGWRVRPPRSRLRSRLAGRWLRYCRIRVLTAYSGVGSSEFRMKLPQDCDQFLRQFIGRFSEESLQYHGFHHQSQAVKTVNEKSFMVCLSKARLLRTGNFGNDIVINIVISCHLIRLSVSRP